MADSVTDVLRRRLEEPSARGLAHAVSRAVRDGVLEPPDRLPPIREVARQLSLSPTTVSSAWKMLARAGTIRTDGRRGTTVGAAVPTGAARYRQALERPPDLPVDLSTGVPDAALLPALAPALAVLDTAGTPRSYLDDPVLPELAAVLRADWPCPAPALTVVDGALDAVELVTRGMLRPGDRAVVEHPCFPPLADLLEHAGIRVLGVPLDAEGMGAREFREAVRGPVDAVFVQPCGHNPTGISMSAERARELAAAVEPSGALVVEDDSTAAISSGPAVSIGRWLPERTVHVRSFSKSHGPELRLAAVSGPAEVVGTVDGLRQAGQGWSSRLLQRILLSLLTDTSAIDQVAAARDAYARRRGSLAAALGERGIEVPGEDGINIWIPVNDETAALTRLAGQGIAVAPGAPFAVLPGQPGRIRVTAGLVAHGHEELAEQLAAAARTADRHPRGR